MSIHSSLMLASRITLLHFSFSAVMNSANCADVIRIGSTPKSARRACAAGWARAVLIVALSLPTISTGVSFGAPIPYYPIAS